ncbi:MAG: iron-containing alcohol dehydrogenase [Proteobacteria bacterium]|nr:iron-containing alcohol dehydrogenase [Pseudomonadota bacterium]MBU4470808.1 iron-containing alcohol dehydrogenase [Pseudomonadota bacterium]MCG2751464.1 iron-containing alcohol dehydrogenase [Desulfobacteraceae bacterium]
MSYWTDDPFLKRLIPLATASFLKGLSSSFKSPTILFGHNLLPEGAGLQPPPLNILAAKLTKKRAFVVTDEFAGRFAKQVVKSLTAAGVTSTIWDKALPEPPINTVKECGVAMTEFEPDLIVAVGGGSVIDTAKAAWILYEHPELEDLFNLSPFTPFTLRNKAILAVFPTTSGTGSETTGVSVITDPAAHRKVPLASPELMPDYAFLVPEFTKSMPPKLTMGTGLDALAHAWDCACLPASNEITDALALCAIEMIFKWLPRAVEDGEDMEARLKMITAASIAGLAFGQGGISLTHSFGHSLGGLFDIHHGLAVGVFIPYATRYYAPVTDKYLNICKALECKGKTDEESLDNLLHKLKDFFARIGAPWTIGDLGITKEDFQEKMEKLVQYSMDDIQTATSPRPITSAQSEKFLRYAYEGQDIDF